MVLFHYIRVHLWYFLIHFRYICGTFFDLLVHLWYFIFIWYFPWYFFWLKMYFSSLDYHRKYQ